MINITIILLLYLYQVGLIHMDQGPHWHRHHVTISPDPGDYFVVFEAVAGATNVSDFTIAVDDVTLTSGACISKAKGNVDCTDYL